MIVFSRHVPYCHIWGKIGSRLLWVHDIHCEKYSDWNSVGGSDLLRFSRKLARRFFRYFFRSLLHFLRSTCTTFTTARTQRNHSILTALNSQRPVLSPNVELSSKFEDQNFATIPPCSTSNTPTDAFSYSKLLLVVSSEYVLWCNVELLWSFHLKWHYRTMWGHRWANDTRASGKTRIDHF